MIILKSYHYTVPKNAEKSAINQLLKALEIVYKAMDVDIEYSKHNKPTFSAVTDFANRRIYLDIEINTLYGYMFKPICKHYDIFWVTSKPWTSEVTLTISIPF